MKKLIFVVVMMIGCATNRGWPDPRFPDGNPVIGMPKIDKISATLAKKEGVVLVTVETSKPSRGVEVHVGGYYEGKRYSAAYRGGFVWSALLPIDELRAAAKDDGVVLFVHTFSPVTGYPMYGEYLLDVTSGRIGRLDERPIAQQIEALRRIYPPYGG